MSTPRTIAKVASDLGVALTVVLFVMPAHGEMLVMLNQITPPLVARFCPTLHDAKLQADRSREAAKRPFDRQYLDHHVHASYNRKCEVLEVSVLPLREEESIQPFEAWSLSYDKNGSDSVGYKVDGRTVLVPVSARVLLVRYYYAKMKDSTNRWYVAWVELPDEPYLLKYLAQRGTFSK